MSETSGQEPRESEVSTSHPKRNVDWGTGFALYCQGQTAGFIGRAIGVRREAVQRHIRDDGWKIKREQAREIVAHAPKASGPADPNEVVVRQLDDAASVAIELITKRLADMNADNAGGADLIQKLTYALARAGQLRRQSRGMSPSEGFAPKQDNRLEIVVRRLPATRAEFDAMKTPDVSAEVPA